MTDSGAPSEGGDYEDPSRRASTRAAKASGSGQAQEQDGQAEAEGTVTGTDGHAAANEQASCQQEDMDDDHDEETESQDKTPAKSPSKPGTTRAKRPHLQGRFSGRLATKEDEKRLSEECRLLAPLMGGTGKRGERSRLTLAKIVRGIATGDVRRHLEAKEAQLTALRNQVAELTSGQGARQVRELTQQVATLKKELAEQKELAERLARSSAGNNDTGTPAGAAAVKVETGAPPLAGQPSHATQPTLQHTSSHPIQHVSIQQFAVQPVQQVSVQGVEHMQVQPVQQVSLMQHVPPQQQPISQVPSQQMPQLQASTQLTGMLGNPGTGAAAPTTSNQALSAGDGAGQQKMQDGAALELRMATLRSEMDARALTIAQAAQGHAVAMSQLQEQTNRIQGLVNFFGGGDVQHEALNQAVTAARQAEAAVEQQAKVHQKAQQEYQDFQLQLATLQAQVQDLSQRSQPAPGLLFQSVTQTMPQSAGGPQSVITSLSQQQNQLQAVQLQQQMNQAATFFINAVPAQQLLDSLGQQQLRPPFTMTLGGIGGTAAPQAAPSLAGLPIFTTAEGAQAAGFHLVPALGLPPSLAGLQYNQLGRLG